MARKKLEHSNGKMIAFRSTKEFLDDLEIIRLHHNTDNSNAIRLAVSLAARQIIESCNPE